MGLTAGPVPPRVDGRVKAGLLTLVAHAQSEGGWSLRKASATLGLEHVRVLRWLDRAAADRLLDAKPGPMVPLHALLDWERAAIVKVAQEWGEIDRSRPLSFSFDEFDINIIKRLQQDGRTSYADLAQKRIDEVIALPEGGVGIDLALHDVELAVDGRQATLRLDED